MNIIMNIMGRGNRVENLGKEIVEIKFHKNCMTYLEPGEHIYAEDHGLGARPIYNLKEVKKHCDVRSIYGMLC